MTFKVVGIVAILLIFWINFSASFALRRDETLETSQKWFQMAFVWLLPVVGGGTVLYLVARHYPKAIPRSALLWPLSMFTKTRSYAGNDNRDENEGPGIDLAFTYRQDHNHGSDTWD